MPVSTAAQLTGSAEFILLVFAVLIVSAARRIYLTYVGARFRPERTIVFALVYVGVGAAISLGSFYEGVPLLLAPLYVFVIAVAVVSAYRYSDHRITFWSQSDGSLYFRGGVLLYLIYLTALIIRLTIDYVVIGPNILSYLLTPGYTLSGAALYGTVATDLLLMFGVGLLAGRSARVMKRYGRIRRGEEKVPTSPSPLRSRLGRGRGSPLLCAPLEPA